MRNLTGYSKESLVGSHSYGAGIRSAVATAIFLIAESKGIACFCRFCVTIKQVFPAKRFALDPTFPKRSACLRQSSAESPPTAALCLCFYQLEINICPGCQRICKPDRTRPDHRLSPDTSRLRILVSIRVRHSARAD